MRSLLTLFSLVASACAYQVLTPANTVGWTTTGPNNVTWQRVNTDQTTFTMVLVNQDKTIMPAGQEILIATVDGSLGIINVPAPSGGFVVGTGFQINFVNDTTHLSSILAQSSQFSITKSNTTASTTTGAPNTAVLTSLGSNPSQTTAGDLNPSSSATNSTSSGKNGADRITAAGSTGLIFAALAAFFL